MQSSYTRKRLTTMAATANSVSWEELKNMILGLAEQSKETDRRMQETDRQMQETDRRIQETDRQMQETGRQMQETGRRLDQLGIQIAGLGDKFGYFTEGMAMPSMERILTEQFQMETINPRARVRRGGREQEYDVLAWANGDVNLSIVVEVKSRVRREAIGQLVGQLESLPQMMPEIKDKARIGILAGVDWDAGVREEALSLGLYTAHIHDEMFELTSPEGFKPKRW
jgi:hypothetical protein